jgi:hypothetical protein
MKTSRTRAFTLIELVAASLIGSLIVTSALGVFAALDRANTRFATRYDQTTDMERTYVAVQHALRTMVISPAIDGEEGDEPARLALEHVPGPIKMRPPDWASSRVMVVGDERDQPQRLEVVVSENPVPNPALQRLSDMGVELLGLDPETVSLAQPVATRGAFILRPVGRTGQTPLWQLIWRPMIALRPAEGATYFTPAPSDFDVVLADDIVWCRWQVYFENQRLLSHSATTVLDLPAYVELELELTSGMMANWMFEIAWTEGPELEPELAPLGTGDGTNPEGGLTGETQSGDTITSPTGTFNRATPPGGGVDR